MNNLIFKHPEPEQLKTRIWPVFMPFMGCPSRCVYCSQDKQTGTGAKTLNDIYQDIKESLPAFFTENTRSPMEIAFFGGTFTALPFEWQIKFIELGASLREKGYITKIRFSTRPDFIKLDQLLTLKAAGLDMVELGIQSFSKYTLKRSGRNYTPETAISACQTVREAGLSLAIQLLPGLPGSVSGDFQKDVAKTIDLLPDAVRVYPCLVVKGTALEKLYLADRYQPWSVEYAEDQLAMSLLRFWGKKINVIRMGVAPESDMDEVVIAGPTHPALGQSARSKALYLHICTRLAMLGSKPNKINIPQKYSGEFWGHKGSLKEDYHMLGINSENVKFTETQLIQIS